MSKEKVRYGLEIKEGDEVKFSESGEEKIEYIAKEYGQGFEAELFAEIEEFKEETLKALTKEVEELKPVPGTGLDYAIDRKDVHKIINNHRDNE